MNDEERIERNDIALQILLVILANDVTRSKIADLAIARGKNPTDELADAAYKMADSFLALGQR